MIINKKGFSLVELLVVVAVIALIGLISTPNIVSGLPKYRIRQAATDLQAKLRQARSTAVRDGETVTIFFDDVKNQYVINGKKFPDSGTLSDYYGSGLTYGSGSVAVTHAINISAVNRKTLTFDAQGMSNSDGNNDSGIWLENNKGGARRIFISTGGAISVQQWNGTTWE